MAYIKTIWEKRVVEFARRFQLTDAVSAEILGVFDFGKVEGLITDDGTPFSTILMDKIEQGIFDADVRSIGNSDLITSIQAILGGLVVFVSDTSVDNMVPNADIVYIAGNFVQVGLSPVGVSENGQHEILANGRVKILGDIDSIRYSSNIVFDAALNNREVQLHIAIYDPAELLLGRIVVDTSPTTNAAEVVLASGRIINATQVREKLGLAVGQDLTGYHFAFDFFSTSNGDIKADASSARAFIDVITTIGTPLTLLDIATSEAIANTQVKRDGSATFKVADPTDPQHPVTLSFAPLNKNNVELDNPQDGDVLVYNSISGKWENKESDDDSAIEITHTTGQITNTSTGGTIYTMQAGETVIVSVGTRDGIIDSHAVNASNSFVHGTETERIRGYNTAQGTFVGVSKDGSERVAISKSSLLQVAWTITSIKT